MLCRLSQLCNSSVFTHFIHFSAALLQAVLQANTEPFRNALVKMRNQREETRNGLGTSLVPVQIVSKRNALSSHALLNMKSWNINPIILISSCLMSFINIFQLWKICWFFVYTKIYCVSAGISTLMHNSDGLGPYIFCRKMEKTRPLREAVDGKVFISAKVSISSS